MKHFYFTMQVRLLALFVVLTAFTTTVKAQQYTLTDADVVVTDGVIQSCSYNFAIKDIVIPETLDGQTVVGIRDGGWSFGVFYNKGIVKITFPNTIRSIGDYAFNSNNLINIAIPESVEAIGNGAFVKNKITSLVIPNSVTSIGRDVFNSNNITGITIGTGLKSIPTFAFSYNKIASVTIPNNITTIGSCAFSSNNLTNVIIPKSVTQIGEKAFYENSGLTSITLPVIEPTGSDLIKWVDTKGNFFDCGASVSDLEAGYTAIFEYILTDDDVVVTNGVIESCSYVFTSNSIIIPETLDGQSVVGIKNGFKNKGIVKITLPNTLKIIGNYAFMHNNLTSLTIPDRVTSIGIDAFYKNQLNNVTIPNNVTRIGKGAFYDNSSLTSITLPTPNYENYKFVNWFDTNLKTYASGSSVTNFKAGYTANFEYTLTDDDVVVEVGIIKSCSYDFTAKTIIIPEALDGQTVVGIADGGVFQSKGLVKITLPNTLKTIGGSAFFNNQLTNVTIPNSVEIIGSDAFSRNEIYNLTIGEGVKEIGDFAFANNQLTSVMIPNSAKIVGEFAFQSNQLSGIIISNNVTTIGRAAFSYNQLTSVTLGSSLTEIGEYAFDANQLTCITIPNSVTTIGKNAFRSNSNLTSITLPTTVLENHKFINWLDTKENSYEGGVTTSDFEVGYTAYFEYTLTNEDVVVEDGIIISCSYDFTAKTIIIPETLDGQTVKGVDDGEYYTGVFKDKGLLSVKYPLFFDTIGDSEFSVNKLTLTPLMLAKVGNYAFHYNKFTELEIPGNVSIIENEAFAFNKISKLTIGYGVTEIRSYAFEYNKLTEVKVPATVYYIGSGAFTGNQLTKIILPIVDKLGYQFKGWKNGDGDVIEGNTAVSNLETSYSAILEPYKFTIKGKVSGADGIEVKMSGDAQQTATLSDGEEYSFTVNYGQSVKVEASKTGYHFATPVYNFTNVVSDKAENNFVAEINSYTIKGKVSGADGVEVKMSGDVQKTVTLNDGQEYSFTVNYGQSVKVEASKTGYHFATSEYNFENVVSDKVNNNFVTEINSYTIKGKVSGADGIEVKMSGDAQKSVTLNDGQEYSFTVNYGQSVKVEASKAGYHFATSEYNFTNVDSDKADNNFVASIITYEISGKVTGADGVLIKLSGDATNDKTVDNGQEYFFTVNYGQSVKVTATKDGYSFEPAEFSFETIQSDKTDNNFVATLITYSVTFNVIDGSNPIANASVTFDGANYSTKADGSLVIDNVKPGNYSYTVAANGYETQNGNITVSADKVSKEIKLSKPTAVDSVNSLLVTVYPNPVNSTLFIELPTDNGIASVQISNITGQVLYQSLNTTEKVLSVDVSDYNSGVLLVKVSNNKGASVIRKIIKK